MTMLACQNCGFTRNTNPKALFCAKCEKERRYQHHCVEWRKQLGLLSYDVILFEITKGIHSKVTVTNQTCGHTFTAKLDNIINRFTKCGMCGPKTRIRKAASKYIEKYGRAYDLTKWVDYKREVWILTNTYYKANKQTINPNNYPRRKPGAHPNAVNLDHVIPMIYGFKHSLPIQLLADPLNIRIIPARDNLSKKQKITLEAKLLLEVLLPKYTSQE